MFYLKPPWCSFWDFPCPHCKCGLNVDGLNVIGLNDDLPDGAYGDLCPHCKKKVFFEVEKCKNGIRIVYLLVRYQMMGGDSGH